jgi:hypothetical protein
MMRERFAVFNPYKRTKICVVDTVRAKAKDLHLIHIR